MKRQRAGRAIPCPPLSRPQAKERRARSDAPYRGFAAAGFGGLAQTDSIGLHWRRHRRDDSQYLMGKLLTVNNLKA